MNGYRNSLLIPNLSDSAITIILVFTLVHGLLFGFGLFNDTALLSGDRSTSRDTTIAYVFNIEKINDKKSNLDKSQATESASHAGNRILELGLNTSQASESAPHVGERLLKLGLNTSQASESVPHVDDGILISDLDTSQASESAPYILDRILNSGHAGDYLIQGVVLALSNSRVLVVLQLSLALLSILCFFQLLRHSGFSVSTATLSTLFYLVLPGSLLPAHQLSSEAFSIPCTVIACYLLVISNEKKGIDTAFVAGLLVLSVAIFVRPQLILFPFLLLIIYLCFSGKKINTILFTILPLSLLFSAVWMVVVLSNNGHFTLGGDDRSVGIAFHDTAEQMAMSGEFELDSNKYKSRTMPFSDFAKIVGDHSSSYIRQRSTSMTNFVVNSGAYSLAVRHLGYFDNRDKFYWQHLRARSGIYESVVEILKRGSAFTTLIIGSTLAWCLVVVFAIAGLSEFIKDKNTKYFAKALLLTLAAYQVGIVMLFSVGARWQHRSLIDFIIILLAIYGLKTLQHYLAARKLSAVY